MVADTEVNATLEKAVRRIVEGYQPEKIILFGSYAYGQPHPDRSHLPWRASARGAGPS